MSRILILFLFLFSVLNILCQENHVFIDVNKLPNPLNQHSKSKKSTSTLISYHGLYFLANFIPKEWKSTDSVIKVKDVDLDKDKTLRFTARLDPVDDQVFYLYGGSNYIFFKDNIGIYCLRNEDTIPRLNENYSYFLRKAKLINTALQEFKMFPPSRNDFGLISTNLNEYYSKLKIRYEEMAKNQVDFMDSLLSNKLINILTHEKFCFAPKKVNT